MRVIEAVSDDEFAPGASEQCSLFESVVPPNDDRSAFWRNVQQDGACRGHRLNHVRSANLHGWDEH